MNYSINLKRLMCVGFVLCLSIASVGCGDDEDDNNGGTGGTAGTGDTGGSSGTGDTGGSAGTGDTGGSGGSTGGTGGSTGGTGGMAPPEPITCGTVTCNPVPTATGAMLPPCCDAANADACGATTTGMAADCNAVGQEGVEDDACPDEMNVLNMTTQGCCKPTGKCGLLSGTLMGCVERTKYPAQFLLSMMPLTDAVDCTYTGGEDAGL